MAACWSQTKAISAPCWRRLSVRYFSCAELVVLRRAHPLSAQATPTVSSHPRPARRRDGVQLTTFKEFPGQRRAARYDEARRAGAAWFGATERTRLLGPG